MYKFVIFPGNHSNVIKEALERRLNWEEVNNNQYSNKNHSINFLNINKKAKFDKNQNEIDYLEILMNANFI